MIERLVVTFVLEVLLIAFWFSSSVLKVCSDFKRGVHWRIIQGFKIPASQRSAQFFVYVYDFSS